MPLSSCELVIIYLYPSLPNAVRCVSLSITESFSTSQRVIRSGSVSLPQQPISSLAMFSVFCQYFCFVQCLFPSAVNSVSFFPSSCEQSNRFSQLSCTRVSMETRKTVSMAKQNCTSCCGIHSAHRYQTSVHRVSHPIGHISVLPVPGQLSVLFLPWRSPRYF